ncbi:MAG: UDP-N-acetylmuramoyl-L-alanine--D-glutamate ligase [Candidatus Spechtbacterales bacterium]
MNYKNKKILIMGLGIHGGGVDDALFFMKNGADVVVTDLRDKEDLAPSIDKINNYCESVNNKASVEWVLGCHREEDFKNCDLVIKNPAVPNNSQFLDIARENNIPMKSSAAIFMDIADTERVIGITGTKGKSSTATLAHEAMKACGLSVKIAGTVGRSLLSALPMEKDEWVVAELSSWQLEDVSKSPHIAIITNIDKDHLDRYESYQDYVEAKKMIFKYQDAHDYLIINEKATFCLDDDAPKQKRSVFSGKEAAAYKELTLNYHPENILCVLKLSEVLGMEKETVLRATSNAKGLSGRLEFIGMVDGIDVYNDTTATNPYATINSIGRFEDKKVAVILGGENKGLDYSDLITSIKDVHHVSLLPGTASDKIYNITNNLQHITNNMVQAKTLKEAIEQCLESEPDVILFSPAAASFNMFKDEFDRGDKFKKEVEKIIKLNARQKDNA